MGKGHQPGRSFGRLRPAHQPHSLGHAFDEKVVVVAALLHVLDLVSYDALGQAQKALVRIALT